MTRYIVRDLETGQLYAWTIKQILYEINRDRTSDFQKYNIKDWYQGWLEMGVEGDIYSLIGKVKIRK